jgi:hypothetical protein
MCLVNMFLNGYFFYHLVSLRHANVIFPQSFCVIYILDTVVELCHCRHCILLLYVFIIQYVTVSSGILFCLQISYELR